MSSTGKKITKTKKLVEKWGNFGTFNTAISYPIEYLQTTFEVSELDELSLAKDIRPSGEVDFELLMQRDIDMERVRTEILKYLRPVAKTESELRTRAAFFPPILAAVIPVHGKDMQDFLPDEIVKREEAGDGNMVVRSWGGILKLKYFEAEESMIVLKLDDGSDQAVDSSPVQIQFKKVADIVLDDSIKLVIIDGQHRLVALREFAKESPEDVQNIVVPVCIVMSPKSTVGNSNIDPVHTVKISKIFRDLFVDINHNAVPVGGHFNTLLSDNTVGNLAARKFCDCVLKNYGKEGLALVEWNIRSLKDSTKINKEYSVTSIGVIELALKKGLTTKKKKGLFKRVLSIGLIEPQLYPTNVDYDYPNPIEYDSFSHGQKSPLEAQVQDQLIMKGLLPIFFESEPYGLLRKDFSSVIQEYQHKVDNKVANATEISEVLSEIIDYMPLGRNSTVNAVKAEVLNSIKLKYAKSVDPIITYAIFQRALIQAWLDLIEVLRINDQLALENMTAGFIKLMNICLKKDSSIFSAQKRYMTHAIFKTTGPIKPTEASRKALVNLMLGFLGSKKVLSQVLDAASVTNHSDFDLNLKLKDLGYKKATEFMIHFKKMRTEEFVKTHSTNYDLPQDEREELSSLDNKFKSDTLGYQNGTVKKEELEQSQDAYFLKVNEHVQAEVENASVELRNALGLETDIVIDGAVEESEDEE